MSNALGDLKYKHYIATCQCGSCPPANCSAPHAPISLIRYGYGTRPSSGDFIPVFIATPKRALTHKQANICSGYGLSFFDTAENARARLQGPAKSAKKIKHKWKSLLSTTINSTDGVVTRVSAAGHLDLHESKNASLELQSVFLESL